MLLRPFRAELTCPLYPGRRFALPWAELLEPFGLLGRPGLDYWSHSGCGAGLSLGPLGGGLPSHVEIDGGCRGCGDGVVANVVERLEAAGAAV